MTSPSLNHRLISASAASGASEPCTMLRPTYECGERVGEEETREGEEGESKEGGTSIQKSPLRDPSSAALGSVAPTRRRPPLITPTQIHKSNEINIISPHSPTTLLILSSTPLNPLMFSPRHTFSFPNHCNDGTRREVGDESLEEGFVLQVVVVLGGELLGGLDDLDGYELVSLPLETSIKNKIKE